MTNKPKPKDTHNIKHPFPNLALPPGFVKPMNIAQYAENLGEEDDEYLFQVEFPDGPKLLRGEDLAQCSQYQLELLYKQAGTKHPMAREIISRFLPLGYGVAPDIVSKNNKIHDLAKVICKAKNPGISPETRVCSSPPHLIDGKYHCPELAGFPLWESYIEAAKAAIEWFDGEGKIND